MTFIDTFSGLVSTSLMKLLSVKKFIYIALIAVSVPTHAEFINTYDFDVTYSAYPLEWIFIPITVVILVVLYFYRISRKVINVKRSDIA